jgi:D-serine deaminase-like pyridoxal phosphate-dependent protein
MVKQNIPYPELDTPVALLDMDKLEANIAEMTKLTAEAGVKLRPHIKVHESADIAKYQMDAGACGIEVGPVDQAIAMVEAGLNDVIIAHPFFGQHKLKKLKGLLEKPKTKVAVVIDMLEQAKGISQVGEMLGKKVPVLIKIEVGGNRYGVLPGEPVLSLAKEISRLSGVTLAGIYAHEVYAEPTTDKQDEVAHEVLQVMNETAILLKTEGLFIDHVSVGSSGTWRAVCKQIASGRYPEVNEIHPGTCIVGAMLSVGRFALTVDQCALSILTSVMSISHPGHAMLDCGLKTLGGDSLRQFSDRPDYLWDNKPSYGLIKGRPDLWLGSLSGEVSSVFYRDPVKKLSLGDRLEIIPNNPYPVINAQDKLYGVRKGKIEKVISVTGRGKGT